MLGVAGGWESKNLVSGYKMVIAPCARDFPHNLITFNISISIPLLRILQTSSRTTFITPPSAMMLIFFFMLFVASMAAPIFSTDNYHQKWREPSIKCNEESRKASGFTLDEDTQNTITPIVLDLCGSQEMDEVHQDRWTENAARWTVSIQNNATSRMPKELCTSNFNRLIQTCVGKTGGKFINSWDLNKVEFTVGMADSAKLFDDEQTFIEEL